MQREERPKASARADSGRDQVKGFGPAESSLRSSTSGSLSHSVRGVWERVRVRALRVISEGDTMFAGAHHAARRYDAKSRAGKIPGIRMPSVRREDREGDFRSSSTSGPLSHRRPRRHSPRFRGRSPRFRGRSPRFRGRRPRSMGEGDALPSARGEGSAGLFST